MSTQQKLPQDLLPKPEHLAWKNTTFQKRNIIPRVTYIEVLVWSSGGALLLQDLDNLMEPWILLSTKKSWRRRSSHQFLTSSCNTLGFYSRTMEKKKKKTKWRFWSGLVKIQTWIHLRCCGMTSKRWLVLRNPPMWLNWKHPAKKSGPTFLHSDVKDSLPVITKAWLQLLGGTTSNYG